LGNVDVEDEAGGVFALESQTSVTAEFASFGSSADGGQGVGDRGGRCNAEGYNALLERLCGF
jgi:hypothetical protein